MTKKISKKELELIILQECILVEQELIVNELAEQYIQSLTEEQLQELTKADMLKTMDNIGRVLTPKIKDAGGKVKKFAKDKLSPLAKDAADIGKAAFAGAKDEFDRKRAMSKYLKLAAQIDPLQKRIDLLRKQQTRLANLSPEVKNYMQQEIVGRMAELTGKETPGATLDKILAQGEASLEQGEGGEANAGKEQVAKPTTTGNAIPQGESINIKRTDGSVTKATKITPENIAQLGIKQSSKDDMLAQMKQGKVFGAWPEDNGIIGYKPVEAADIVPSEPAQQDTPKAPDEEQEVDDKDIVSRRSRPAFDMTDDGKKPARRRKLEEEITEAVIQNILKLKDK